MVLPKDIPIALWSGGTMVQAATITASEADAAKNAPLGIAVDATKPKVQ
jgi:hypothetical protein